MGPPPYVYVRWIGTGKPERGLLDDMRAHLESLFPAPSMVLPPVEPPDFFDPARGQYSSTKILRWILQDLPVRTRKILAVTDGDLFIPVLTFVFGEAQLGGVAAVVSTARLCVDANGGRCAPELFRERMRKECTHEVGHTFGLAHCALARCAMSRSNTVSEVDAKSGQLCRDCREQLRQLAAREESDRR